MGPFGRLLGILSGCLVLAAAVWVGRYSPWAAFREQRAKAAEASARQPAKKSIPLTADELKELDRRQRQQQEDEQERLGYRRPKISAKPPFPKLVADAAVFDLGIMPLDQTSGHKFQIRNEGQAPLVLVLVPPPCKTTFPPISRRQEIAPGRSVEIELTGTPREPTPAFAKTISFWTNDPERPEVNFKVFGRAVQLLRAEPERVWYAGHVTDDRDGVVTGTVTSDFAPDFKITSVEVPDDNVKLHYRPLSDRERLRDGLNPGYHFAVTVSRNIPAGPFRRELRIHTTLPRHNTIIVELTALRTGPILFLSPIGNSRAYWQVEKSLINLGRFPHEAGSKVILPALVYGLKEKFAITGVEKDADFVNVRVLPDRELSYGQWQGVRFVFEVPPGLPPTTRIQPHSVHVNLKTNHPKLRDMSCQVEFVSQ